MNHRPRKRFAQNFLRDEHVIHAIVNAIAPGKDEHLVEIGPGQGALTSELLEACGILDVVEVDRDLVSLLHARFTGVDTLRIHAADALKFDFTALSRGEKLRIVGNLPYNISTPLLFHLFAQQTVIADMHFMLQKEVVERLGAQPGEAAYGRLSLMAQYHCHIESLLDVPPESFYPRPKVMSAVVRLIPYSTPPVDVRIKTLERLVTTAFSQRRKTLRNALSTLFTAGELSALGIDPGVRAETLSLDDYARLSRFLDARSAHP